MHILILSKKEQGGKWMKSLLIKGVIALSLVAFIGCGDNATISEGDKPLIPQNEPYYPYLWQLDSKNTVLRGKGYDIDENADANVVDAWSKTQGAGVRVAVIDDGFDTRHEDLASNIAVTYNADTGSSSVIYYGFDGAHGGSCAGFIAAPVNKVGIVGVAPQSKLILIKENLYTDSKIIKAFEYAKQQGARVVSCSWGTGQVSEAVEAEFKSLYDAGITIVFASGNNGEDLDTNGSHDESESDWVIGVGASGENNDVTGYSDYGYNIDLLAPAGNRNYSLGVLALDDMGFKGRDTQEGMVNNNYAYVYGTSFACPIVSGAATLLYSIRPDLTPKKVREILIKSADKIGENASYNRDGFDEEKRRAYGKVNISKALEISSRY